MHAIAIAEELEIARILIPVGPGNFAAFGSLISDLRRDYSQTRTLLLEPGTLAAVEAQFGEMEAVARANLIAEGVAAPDIEMRRQAGMRYLGQSWELAVDLPAAITSLDQLLQAFANVHDKRFGHRSGGSVEIVNFRLAAIGRVPKPALPRLESAPSGQHARIGNRSVFLGGKFVDTPIVQRERLSPGETVRAPALIMEDGSLTLVSPGWRATVLEHGELMLERS